MEKKYNKNEKNESSKENTKLNAKYCEYATVAIQVQHLLMNILVNYCYTYRR
jgi:hypothetical protein